MTILLYLGLLFSKKTGEFFGYPSEHTRTYSKLEIKTVQQYW